MCEGREREQKSKPTTGNSEKPLFGLEEKPEEIYGVCEADFMSAGFESAVILSLFQISFPFTTTTPSSSSFSGLKALLNALHFCSKQRLILEFPSLSMRLRPKRTCSGVEVFGGFHIKQKQPFFIFR
ncbi:PREDICTED: uncharacterized protein LOC104821939 [Tarenaya hassleriana]|uniref:uncharacterized protein LOC104821939 n=1 Tax=Tarenaya hassleriana TaxID=28532 RepID=UPI00053C355A|nr:PREDICTED: uncharacterized protein LOC104821939 [Tarenaya hassleriana]